MDQLTTGNKISLEIYCGEHEKKINYIQYKEKISNDRLKCDDCDLSNPLNLIQTFKQYEKRLTIDQLSINSIFRDTKRIKETLERCIRQLNEIIQNNLAQTLKKALEKLEEGMSKIGLKRFKDFTKNDLIEFANYLSKSQQEQQKEVDQQQNKYKNQEKTICLGLMSELNHSLEDLFLFNQDLNELFRVLKTKNIFNQDKIQKEPLYDEIDLKSEYIPPKTSSINCQTHQDHSIQYLDVNQYKEKRAICQQCIDQITEKQINISKALQQHMQNYQDFEEKFLIKAIETNKSIIEDILFNIKNLENFSDKNYQNLNFLVDIQKLLYQIRKENKQYLNIKNQNQLEQFAEYYYQIYHGNRELIVNENSYQAIKSYVFSNLKIEVDLAMPLEQNIDITKQQVIKQKFFELQQLFSRKIVSAKIIEEKNHLFIAQLYQLQIYNSITMEYIQTIEAGNKILQFHIQQDGKKLALLHPNSELSILKLYEQESNQPYMNNISQIQLKSEIFFLEWKNDKIYIGLKDMISIYEEKSLKNNSFSLIKEQDVLIQADILVGHNSLPCLASGYKCTFALLNKKEKKNAHYSRINLQENQSEEIVSIFQEKTTKKIPLQIKAKQNNLKANRNLSAAKQGRENPKDSGKAGDPPETNQSVWYVLTKSFVFTFDCQVKGEQISIKQKKVIQIQNNLDCQKWLLNNYVWMYVNEQNKTILTFENLKNKEILKFEEENINFLYLLSLEQEIVTILISKDNQFLKQEMHKQALFSSYQNKGKEQQDIKMRNVGPQSKKM